jgi:hypothetical protein
MSSFFRFLVLLVGLSLVIYFLVEQLANMELIERPSYLVSTIAVLLVSTFIAFYFLGRSRPSHPLDFVKNYLLSVVLKIMFGGVYVFAIMRFDMPSANANAIFFLICYFIFTALQVTALTIKKNAE